MAVSYKKPWKLLIDKDLKKKDLEAKVGINYYKMNKLTKDENVTIDTLGKICKALDCTIEEIVQFIDITA